MTPESQATRSDLPPIPLSPGAPYFITGESQPRRPCSHSGAIFWEEFQSLFRRKEIRRIDRHLARLAHHGITYLWLIMEFPELANATWRSLPAASALPWSSFPLDCLG